MTIIDCAVYEDGTRRQGELELGEAYEAGRQNGDGVHRFVWIGLKSPSPEEFDSVAREFHLHELAVEDAIKAHQRPKLELYDDTLFVVLKTARYHDAKESVELGELMGALAQAAYTGEATTPEEAVAYARRLRQNPGR